MRDSMPFAGVMLGLLLVVTPLLRADEADVPKRALLIGIAKYGQLPPADQLEGCANDVEAVATLLRERFEFADDQIVSLVNEAATAEAIRQRLADVARFVEELPPDAPTAQVVFHYSGHGSQLLDQPDGPHRDEHDGLDETLVPYDASRQGGEEDIRDDELFEAVSAICAGGKARMWIILDCCHSGTGVRGSTKVRQLHRSLSAPVATSAPAAGTGSKRLPPGVIALYACRDNEVEPEYEQGSLKYGLLTRFLVQVLSEATQLDTLSYEQVRDAIIRRYQQDASVIRAPLPQLEGDGPLLRRPVLSALGRERPPYWEAMLDEGSRGEQLLLKAGAFHGVTVGSLYELYATAESVVTDKSAVSTTRNGDSVGWLHIESVAGATSRASAFRWDGEERITMRLPSTLKTGYAIERFHQQGDFVLKLKVLSLRDGVEQSLDPESPEIPTSLATTLRELQQGDASAWLQWVAADEPCDLVLRVDDSLAALFPATGIAQVDAPADEDVVAGSLVGGWGPPFDLRRPADHPEYGIGLLGDALRRITRARNLIRVVSAQAASPNGPHVELELVRVADDGRTVTPWESRPEDRTTYALGGGTTGGDDPHLQAMRDRDLFAFRVTNRETSGKPVFVSVLLIDVDMGIEQILPWQQGTDLIGDNEIRPGEFVDTLPAFECNGGAFVDDPANRTSPVYGRRSAVLLATREPNQFYRLAQPSLPRVSADELPRLKEPGTRSGPPGSLETLLLQETYFQTRARRRRPQQLYDDSWSSAIVNWVAVPSDGSP